MTTIFYVFFFILGAAFGSFLNVVIFRINTKESILIARSHCLFYELIPLLSFFLQKGKCRKCKKKISWQYFFVELFTGIAFLLIIINFFDFTFFSILITIYYLLIISLLIVIFVYDLKHYLVPDEVIYPAIIIAFLYDFYLVVISGFQLFAFQYLLAGLIGGGFFLAMVLISKGKWMGVGDIKIGLLMGLFLGLSHLFTALFLAFLSGAIISGFLLLLKKKNLKSEIPFGPFLTSATFVVLLWGDLLIKWYLGLFL